MISLPGDTIQVSEMLFEKYKGEILSRRHTAHRYEAGIQRHPNVDEGLSYSLRYS